MIKYTPLFLPNMKSILSPEHEQESSVPLPEAVPLFFQRIPVLFPAAPVLIPVCLHKPEQLLFRLFPRHSSHIHPVPVLPRQIEYSPA